jgi:DNA (cytosine-5)-methyltransferase 1
MIMEYGKKVVSIFSNIGVGEAYLSRCGLKVSVACELENDRCLVYKSIYPDVNVICGDITKDNISNELIEKAKDTFLLIATPPCQGFSTLNPKGEGDPRNNLVLYTLELVKKIQPSYVLLENVPQMIKAFENNNIVKHIENMLPDYTMKFDILNAADFDTPQNRRRAIVLLTKNGNKEWEFPVVNKDKQPITLKTAFKGIPTLESGDKLRIM